MAENMTLLGLNVLRQVANSGSFAAAARELGYTQSAVSRQMAALETAAGEPLFERGRRGVVLTPAGDVVLAGAERAITEMEAIRQRLAGLRDRIAGRLVIGAFPTAGAVLVPRAIAALRRDHPALEVVLDEAATTVLLRRMQDRRLDVAVVALDPDAPAVAADFEVHPMPVIGLRIVVPDGHRLAAHRVVRVDDLTDEEWIVGNGAAGESQFGAWPTLDWPRVAYRVRHWTTRLGLVAAGLGISVLPGAMSGAVPAGTRVITVTDPARRARHSVLLTRPYPGDSTTLAVEALLVQAELMRAEAG